MTTKYKRRPMSVFILAIVAVIFSAVAAKSVFQSPIHRANDKGQPRRTLADFHPPLFWNRPQEGFYDVDLSVLDAEGAGLTLMAIGDVDSDGYSDLVTMTEQGDTFKVHFYDPNTRTFEAGRSQAVRAPGGEGHEPKIANIVISRNMEIF